MDYLERMLLEDCRLTTAEIIYRLPDHPSILQTYIWQELDVTPDFPELQRFLAFWDRTLEGKVHSVCVTACEEVRPSSYVSRGRAVRMH